VICGLEEFIDENLDLEDVLRTFEIGDVYYGGGGASPSWSVRRINDA